MFGNMRVELFRSLLGALFWIYGTALWGWLCDAGVKAFYWEALLSLETQNSLLFVEQVPCAKSSPLIHLGFASGRPVRCGLVWVCSKRISELSTLFYPCESFRTYWFKKYRYMYVRKLGEVCGVRIPTRNENQRFVETQHIPKGNAHGKCNLTFKGVS
jgi:hypothetical protein